MSTAKIISDLVGGNILRDGNLTVIIGETDTVAFKDSEGWQVAGSVNWQNTDADIDHLIRRKRLNDIISRKFPEGTLDEFYSESSDHAMVIDKEGTVWQIYPDGGVKYYR